MVTHAEFALQDFSPDLPLGEGKIANVCKIASKVKIWSTQPSLIMHLFVRLDRVTSPVWDLEVGDLLSPISHVVKSRVIQQL